MAPTGFDQALDALDRLLGIAVDQLTAVNGPQSLLDPWRGMHLDRAGVERLLNQRQGVLLSPDAETPSLLARAMRSAPRVEALAARLDLTDADLAILLVALAPDLDLRYQRIYGYLQDDLSRHRPTADLFANLLAGSLGERSALTARLQRSAPLRLHALLEALPGREDEFGPLGCAWRVDEIWRDWLVERDAPDAPEIPPLEIPRGPLLDDLPLIDATRELLKSACAAAADQGLPLRLLMQGPPGSGKSATVEAVASRLKLRLLRLDLQRVDSATEIQRRLERGGRAAALFGAVLYLPGIDGGERRDAVWLNSLLKSAANCPGHVILASTAALPSCQGSAPPLLRVEFAFPNAEQRTLLWRERLREIGADAEPGAEEPVAARFALSAEQIRRAATEAQLRALTTNAGPLRTADLAAAARDQSGSELALMAQRIAPVADFDALVVPAEVKAQLREICNRVATREAVSRGWAAGSVHARAVGVTALFAGPSGTGKTLAAEALARELGLDLYRIDLAGIVSKYIGETEKNLDRVFAAAERSNAVLFFDEADALFGKRSEVKDSHDRYANIEIAYLLQKMEQFDGLAILATNLKQNLDEAFGRRLTFAVNFPFPEEAERRELWERLWPSSAPRATDVDLSWFAKEYRLSGGNIRNIVFAALHLAAAQGDQVEREHVMLATRREFQKLGRNLADPTKVPAWRTA